MRIILRNNETIVVSQKQASQIKKAIQNGAVGFELGDEWIRADYIVRIANGGITEAERVPKENRLAEIDHREQPSPAKEILRQKYGTR